MTMWQNAPSMYIIPQHDWAANHGLGNTIFFCFKYEKLKKKKKDQENQQNSKHRVPVLSELQIKSLPEIF